MAIEAEPIFKNQAPAKRATGPSYRKTHRGPLSHSGLRLEKYPRATGVLDSSFAVTPRFDLKVSQRSSDCALCVLQNATGQSDCDTESSARRRAGRKGRIM